MYMADYGKSGNKVPGMNYFYSTNMASIYVYDQYIHTCDINIYVQAALVHDVQHVNLLNTSIVLWSRSTKILMISLIKRKVQSSHMYTYL